jgi:hypothetical protein
LIVEEDESFSNQTSFFRELDQQVELRGYEKEARGEGLQEILNGFDEYSMVSRYAASTLSDNSDVDNTKYVYEDNTNSFQVFQVEA